MTTNIKVLTPGLLARGTFDPAPCGGYCSGPQDVQTMDCPPGTPYEQCTPYVPGCVYQYDCTAPDHADTDYCCAGTGFTPNDAMDHASCASNDAGWGFVCPISYMDFWGS